MPTNEQKGVTIKIGAELHAEVKRYIEEHSMTMGDFVALALQDELHSKLTIKEDKNMGNMRTLAFQVPEEPFQRIKDYLQRNNMTQKEFVIGLIENEINRDLTQRAAVREAPTDSVEVTEEHAEQKGTAVENISKEVGEQLEEQNNAAVSDGYNCENEDVDEEQNEAEEMGMSMGM